MYKFYLNLLNIITYKLVCFECEHPQKTILEPNFLLEQIQSLHPTPYFPIPNSFTLKNLAAFSQASSSLWPTFDYCKLFIVSQCKKLSSLVLCYILLEW